MKKHLFVWGMVILLSFIFNEFEQAKAGTQQAAGYPLTVVISSNYNLPYFETNYPEYEARITNGAGTFKWIVYGAKVIEQQDSGITSRVRFQVDPGQTGIFIQVVINDSPAGCSGAASVTAYRKNR